MLKNVLKTVVPLILFLFIITNTLLANEPDNKPKYIFRSKCENSTKEISLLDRFQDKSFIIEISDFGGGYISFKMTLYNNSDCKSSWLNKLEYFEIKNYILLTENLESLKSGKKISMSNSTLWTPSGKIMELSTSSEEVAKELMIPKKCSLLQNSGEPVIIDKNCMGDNEFFQFKKKKDFFPGAFLALKYDNELNRLLLFENDEGDPYNNGNRYISLFPTYTD